MTNTIYDTTAEITSFFDYAERHELALLPIPYGFKEDPGWKPENREADPTLRPIVWRWSKECSKDRTDWAAWYAQNQCNFGIAAAASGCIALDIDVSADREIWNKFCAFWMARSIVPPSPQFKSARDGWHILVRVSSALRIDDAELQIEQWFGAKESPAAFILAGDFVTLGKAAGWRNGHEARSAAMKRAGFVSVRAMFNKKRSRLWLRTPLLTPAVDGLPRYVVSTPIAGTAQVRLCHPSQSGYAL